MDRDITRHFVKFPLAARVLVLALALGAWRASEAGELRLYVSPSGNDAWSGTLAAPSAANSDGPFASLERARDEIRNRTKAGGLPDGGVTVWIAGGVYERNRAFELGPADSGTEKSPIVYRGQPGAEVRLIGGKRVTGFRPVSDPAVLQRLDPAARGKVLQADLKAQGITDYGRPSGGGIELFFQDKPMTPARWPNRGLRQDRPVLGETPVDVRGTKGCREGVFAYEGDRPAAGPARRTCGSTATGSGTGPTSGSGSSPSTPRSGRSPWPRRTTATGIAKGSGSTPSTCWRNLTSPASGTSIAKRASCTSGRPLPSAMGRRSSPSCRRSCTQGRLICDHPRVDAGGRARHRGRHKRRVARPDRRLHDPQRAAAMR